MAHRFNDNMDWICQRFMLALRKQYRGHKSEIHARQFTRLAEKFALLYNIKPEVMLDALLRRNYFEPIGSDTYAVHYYKIDEE